MKEDENNEKILFFLKIIQRGVKQDDNPMFADEEMAPALKNIGNYLKKSTDKDLISLCFEDIKAMSEYETFPVETISNLVEVIKPQLE